MVNVLAHEITHSWSGNLVTNESWQHFWLNEGWTKYMEMKIMQRKVMIDKEAEIQGIKKENEKFTKIDINKLSQLSIDFGAKYHALLIMNGNYELVSDVNLFGINHEFTKLNPCLDNTDPDEAYSRIPYEKGAQFLFYLETLVGGETIFDPFIKHYFDTFAEESIGYKEFQDCIIDYFNNIDNKIGDLLKTTVDWDAWINKPGMSVVDYKETLKIKAKRLNVKNIFEMTEVVDKLVKKWVSIDLKSLKNKNSNNGKDFENLVNGMNDWFVDQKEMFLDEMLVQWRSQIEKKEVRLGELRNKLLSMNKMYAFLDDDDDDDGLDEKKDGGTDSDGNGKSKIVNAEILYRFFRLVIECEEESLYQSLVDKMLSCFGRMKVKIHCLGRNILVHVLCVCLFFCIVLQNIVCTSFISRIG